MNIIYLPVCACVRVLACVRMRECACACTRVALLIQHTTRMRHIVSSFVAPSGSTTLPHYLINGTIFWKKVIEHKMCILVFSTTFV